MTDFKKSIALALLVLAPTTASANVGTLLTIAAGLHFYIGNAILGIIEGLIIARWFKCSKPRAIALLVAANYFSVLLGAFILQGLIDLSGGLTIETLRTGFILLSIAAFVVTLVLEFPFFWAAINSFKRAIRATLIVHVITYSLLYLGFLFLGETSMITGLKVVNPEKLALGSNYSLVYITPDGREVVESKISPSIPTPVANISHDDWRTHLVTKKNSSGKFDLYRRVWSSEDDVLLKANFAIKAPEAPSFSTHFGNNPHPSLLDETDWEISTGYWAKSGISGTNTKTLEKWKFAIESILIMWRAQNATLVHDDRIVFLLGADQICILDPFSHEIALLARGTGPIVVEK